MSSQYRANLVLRMMLKTSELGDAQRNGGGGESASKTGDERPIDRRRERARAKLFEQCRALCSNLFEESSSNPDQAAYRRLDALELCSGERAPVGNAEDEDSKCEPHRYRRTDRQSRQSEHPSRGALDQRTRCVRPVEQAQVEISELAAGA